MNYRLHISLTTRQINEILLSLKARRDWLSESGLPTSYNARAEQKIRDALHVAKHGKSK